MPILDAVMKQFSGVHGDDTGWCVPVDAQEDIGEVSVLYLLASFWKELG
jgi:hypothetical protein